MGCGGWMTPGAAPAPPVMGRLGPRFRARDIAGKIALVYAVALRPMARNEFGAILAECIIPKVDTGFPKRSCSKQTARSGALAHDMCGYAYLYS
jgi:hypothetical protein